MSEDIKNYRDNELKWFGIASVVIILVLSRTIRQDIGDSQSIVAWIDLVVKILNSTLIASSITVITFIADSIIDVRTKERLVFWRGHLPGETVFSRYKIKTKDKRFSADMVCRKYQKVYEGLDKAVNRYDYENANWYAIYKIYRDEPIIKAANRDYLLCRDMASIITIQFMLYLVGVIAELIEFNWRCIFYLIITFLLLKVATNNKGERLVANVISMDIVAENEKEKK